MTAEDERRAQLLAAELAEHDHLVVQMDPVEALAVIGMLQLALRHPNAPAGPSQIAIAVIERVVHAYKLRGDSREFVRVVSEGWPAKQPLGDLVDPAHPERLGCRCPDPLREVHPACPWHGHSPHPDPAERDLLPAHIRARMQEMVVAPSTIAKLFDVEVDESLPPGVVAVRGDRGRLEAVRPAGLVWSGIRVDELERVGYEVLDRSHPDCPVPLADGEIVGEPMTGRIFVWSRADFDRLAELSRRLHDARRRGLPYKPDAARPVAGRSEQVQLARVVELLGIEAESVAIARALEAGG